MVELLKSLDLIIGVMVAVLLAAIAKSTYSLSRILKKHFEWSRKIHTQEIVDLPFEVVEVLRELDLQKGLDELDKRQRADLQIALNYIEHISLGVNNGLYDEKIVRDSLGHFLVTMFVEMRPSIYYLRSLKSSSSLYVEYERLVRRWDADEGGLKFSNHGGRDK